MAEIKIGESGCSLVWLRVGSRTCPSFGNAAAGALRPFPTGLSGCVKAGGRLQRANRDNCFFGVFGVNPIKTIKNIGFGYLGSPDR